MKKILIISLSIYLALSVYSVRIASSKTSGDDQKVVSIPADAVEIAPNVFYLGRQVFNGQEADGYAYVNTYTGAPAETGLVEVFINKLYNDFNTDELNEESYLSIAHPFYTKLEHATRDSGLLWFTATEDNKRNSDERIAPPGYLYTHQYNNATARYYACLNAVCLPQELLAPEYQPEVGDIYKNKAITSIGFYSWGMIQTKEVHLVPDRPVVQRVTKGSDNTLVIKGLNFYNSRVNIDGKEFIKSSGCVGQRANDTITIDLKIKQCELRTVPNNIHSIKVYNDNYGSVNPGWSEVKTFKI